MECYCGFTKSVKRGDKEKMTPKTRILLLVFCYCIAFIGCTASLKNGKGRKRKNKGTIEINQKEEKGDTTIGITTDNIKNEEILNGNEILSKASQIMIKACDNYLYINKENSKTAEVMILKASVYYNNKMFEKSRNVYKKIVENFKNSADAIEAIRMIAQSYYEEKNFDEAQSWYRKLKDIASGQGGKSEAVARIAESIFRMAELHEKAKSYTDAAIQYERVALEFPDASIADISLFNAGLSYEKEALWTKAILMYQRLKQRYMTSELIPKSMFRTAKAYEKMKQWDDAAQTYLRLVANFPKSNLAQTCLYNAGFSFENGEKLIEAATTFEKLASAFPGSSDAADVLFKAGELYGKVKDWEGVTRVNQVFSRIYGNDKERVVQAKCMVGVAFYMQDQRGNAINQLKTAVSVFRELKKPSTANKFYAAKAQFTLGDIYHEYMDEIKLLQPQYVYKKLMKQKNNYLDNAVESYSKVIQYGISEWTTRSVFQIGQTYEDFAIGVFKQQRPDNLSVDKSIALELGIAKAVDEYFINSAMHYHEQNVKLGIKEKIENKYILNSKMKLTYLPFVAGENYLSLVKITQKREEKTNLSGFALIAQKLQVLQKIAPFQERAIGLLLNCLEMGARYQEYNTFYEKASKRITQITFVVAHTYGEVVDIARGAPIPKNFDLYEEFLYKIKLLKQIETYEESCLNNYLKTVKISQAYSIADEFVDKAKKQIPEILFNTGRCYDLLCISAFEHPPYPKDINESEKEEYAAQFEEIALTYQEQAFEIYKTILDFSDKGYASGDYVSHAYVRLYNNFPDEYGVETEKIIKRSFSSGPKWKVSKDSINNWETLDFDDKGWNKATKEEIGKSITISGFPEKVPVGMWYKQDEQNEKVNRVFFRRTFYIQEPPLKTVLYLVAIDDYSVSLNGKMLVRDSVSVIKWNKADFWDLAGKMRQGKNVLAIEAINNIRSGYGVFPLIVMKVPLNEYLPRFPGAKDVVDKKLVSEDTYSFPYIKNFSFQ